MENLASDWKHFYIVSLIVFIIKCGICGSSDVVYECAMVNLWFCNGAICELFRGVYGICDEVAIAVVFSTPLTPLNHHTECSLYLWRYYMMTSSNGKNFRVTGHLCGEFTGPGEFPAQRPVTRSFDISLICVRINGWISNREAGDLGRHRAHNAVIVMNVKQP